MKDFAWTASINLNLKDGVFTGEIKKIYTLLNKTYSKLVPLFDDPKILSGNVHLKVVAPKDTEIRALCLACLAFPRDPYLWHLRLYLDKHVGVLGGDLQSRLLLDCKSLPEALSRLHNLNPGYLVRLQRNLAKELERAFRKLHFSKIPKKVEYPQRKRGYTDKGHLGKEKAYRDARLFYVDTEIQMKKYRDQQTEKDTLNFLKGFTE